jgi:hypothetical protein
MVAPLTGVDPAACRGTPPDLDRRAHVAADVAGEEDLEVALVTAGDEDRLLLLEDHRPGDAARAVEAHEEVEPGAGIAGRADREPGGKDPAHGLARAIGGGRGWVALHRPEGVGFWERPAELVGAGLSAARLDRPEEQQDQGEEKRGHARAPPIRVGSSRAQPPPFHLDHRQGRPAARVLWSACLHESRRG